jgi:hypothetical protein
MREPGRQWLQCLNSRSRVPSAAIDQSQASLNSSRNARVISIASGTPLQAWRPDPNGENAVRE